MSIYYKDKKVDQSSMIGCIIAFAGPNVPQGWLACNGQLMQSRNSDGSPTPYEALYLVIGNTYGEGVETGSFKLPDLAQRFIEGANGNLNTTVEDGLADHSHTFTGSTSNASGIPTGSGYNTSGNHTHTRGSWNFTGSIKVQYANRQGSWIYFPFAYTSGAFSTSTISGASFNNGSVAYNTQSFSRLVKMSTNGKWTGATSDPGNHTHNVTASGTVSTITGDMYNTNGKVQPKSACVQYIIKYK